MKKAILIIFAILTGAFFISTKANAQTPSSGNCQPIYGGGENCANTPFTISKRILNPQTNTFVDNLGMNDAKYHPGDIITFQITVSTQSTTTNVTLKDILPQSITFSSGPGAFDKVTNTLTLTIDKLTSDKPQIFTILGRIADTADAQSSFCDNNRAILTKDNQTVTTTTQYCIEKITPSINQHLTKGSTKTLPSVTHNPKTGAKTNMLFAFIAIGLMGIAIRRINIKR